MSLLEARLKHTSRTTRQVTLIGMIFGTSLAAIFAFIPSVGLWKGLYAGAGVWIASYTFAVQISSRQTSRLRPLLAWSLGLMVFSASLLYYQGFLSVLLFPGGLAYLVQRAVNAVTYLINPYARFEDQLLDHLASSAVQRNPAAAGKQLRKLISHHQKTLTRALEADLGRSERQPGSKASTQPFQRVIDLITLGGDPPQALLPLLGRAYLGLGRTLFEQGRHAEAVEALKSSAGPHRERLFYLGWAHVRVGDYNAGILAYQEALRHAGPDAELCYRLGCALAHIGRYRPALESLRQSLELEESAKTYIQIGNAHTALGEWKAAREALHKGLELAPTADGWYSEAICLARMGEPQPAERSLQRALEQDASHQPSLLALGILLEAAGNVEGAHSAYERAAAIIPDDPHTRLRMGALANRRGLHTEALAALSAAWQAGIQSDELYYQLGLANAKTGHWDEAIAAWSLLLDRHPQDETLRRAVDNCHYERGRQRFAAGDYAGAVQDWEACLASTDAQDGLREAFREAAFRQAAGLLHTVATSPASLNEARAALKKASDYAHPGEDRLLWLDALLQLAAGDFQTAARDLAQLQRAFSGEARLAYHLGFALYQAGQGSQAVPYLEQALEAPLSASQRQAASLMLAEYSAAADQWDDAAQMYRLAFETQAELSRG